MMSLTNQSARVLKMQPGIPEIVRTVWEIDTFGVEGVEEERRIAVVARG
jgi:hypothetical protein